MFVIYCIPYCLLHCGKDRERAVTFEFDDVGDLFDAKGVFVLVRESEHADFGRGT
jgi:hypothetical protein